MSQTETIEAAGTDWVKRAEELGRAFAERAASHDQDDLFVRRNCEELKAAKIYSAGVPVLLGGGGASYEELCGIVRTLARACGSTALALSMHMHLLATLVWRRKHLSAPVDPLLRRIAADQAILVSTGGADWLAGSGKAEPVDGGFRVTGRKIFASGCQAGDLLLTMAVLDDPAQGPTVLHFGLPMNSPEIKILETWRSLGMRGTGSHDLELNGVFVPESAVIVRRPQGKWHPAMHVVAMEALPLIYSAYTGVAEAARDIAVKEARRKNRAGDLELVVGAMENELAAARMALRTLVEAGAEGKPGPETTNATMTARTLSARSCIKTVELAMEAAGGAAFYRSLGLERLFRDVQGARYHPMREPAQQRYAGRMALGLSIDGDAPN